MLRWKGLYVNWDVDLSYIGQIICVNKWSWKDLESEAGVRSPAIVEFSDWLEELLISLPRISATQVLGELDQLKGWIDKNDNLVVDRGFRDVISALANFGYDTHMSSVFKTGESQHDSLEGNKGRFVTETRWVVASYHDKLKQWTFFKERLKCNHFIPVFGSFIRGISACLEQFTTQVQTRRLET